MYNPWKCVEMKLTASAQLTHSLDHIRGPIYRLQNVHCGVNERHQFPQRGVEIQELLITRNVN